MRNEHIIRAKWDPKYLDEFVTLRCAPDLLLDRVFPNVKEITEAMSPWVFARKILGGPAFGNREAVVYCVADGNSPRAGAIFAYMTAWHVNSIDPRLKPASPRWQAIKRLSLWRMTLDEARSGGMVVTAPLSVVVAMHAHCRIDGLWQEIKGPKLAIACPCCTDILAGMPAPRSWMDFGILSPERTIYTWAEGLSPITKKAKS